MQTYLETYEAVMLLPFAIGINEQVRQGDGLRHGEMGNDSLYRHGICDPTLIGHGTPLAVVLMDWYELVSGEAW